MRAANDKLVQRVAGSLAGRMLAIGVDRMDYSKGLPQRFEALARLLEKHPEHRRHVHFLQICPRSREEVDEYRKLRAELDRLAGRINGRFSEFDWTPLRYSTRAAPRTTLAGPLPHRPHRRGDAAARRHEPGRQGIRRRPGRRRSGRAGPVAVRRRGARAHRGADRQSVRSRRHRRRHASRPHHAARRAQGTAQRAAQEKVFRTTAHAYCQRFIEALGQVKAQLGAARGGLGAHHIVLAARPGHSRS